MADDPEEAWGADEAQPDTWHQSPGSWGGQNWSEWAEPQSRWAGPGPQWVDSDSDPEPGPRRARRGSGAAIAVGAAVVVVLAAVGVVAALLVSGMPVDDDESVTAGGPGGKAVWTTEGRAGVSGAAPVHDVPGTSEGEGNPDSLVTSSSSVVDSVEGYWVPQLGAMRIGSGSSTDEWTEEDVLVAFEGYRARYPDAAMLWSGDWAVYTEPYWYVVIVASPAADPDTVLRWCRDEGFDANSCLAKKLSRDGSPQSATRVNS